MHWTTTLAPKPPRRRYPFWARRDRRRAAQALAGGRSQEQVALVNRVPVMEIERLLRDEEFQELVRHYRAIAGLTYEERVARLAPIALELLEMGLETGDMRVAMFVLHEQQQGRDPARSIAVAAIRRIEQAEGQAQPAPERRPARPAAPPKKPGDWDHCAAVSEQPEDAEALALSELACVRAANRTVLRRLADRLAGEAERMGTALGALDRPALRLEATARGVARYWHARPLQSLNAAERLQAARRTGSHAPTPGPRATGPPDG